MRGRALFMLLLACAAAMLFHHLHNAMFLAEYPNMPAWLSRWQVYAAWLGATAIGLIGYWCLRCGYRFTGTSLLIAYGIYGLDSLVHYLRAPVSAHTLTMNLSIWLEAATAAALLVVLLRRRYE
jgi:hypothetical protein